jgi:hypothetical protein
MSPDGIGIQSVLGLKADAVGRKIKSGAGANPGSTQPRLLSQQPTDLSVYVAASLRPV